MLRCSVTGGPIGRSNDLHMMTVNPPELVIGDPHAQSGLVDKIAPGANPVRIVNFYHFSGWPNEKAYCAKCAARKHRDGFTVELDDGSFILAGSTCGSDLWGDRWIKVSQEFQDHLYHAGIIIDARNVLEDLRDIRNALQRWKPAINKVAGFQGHFRGSMPLLFNALAGVAGSESQAFFETSDLVSRLNLALQQLDEAIAAGEGQQVTKLGVRTATIREARDHLDVIAHALRAGRNFFTQDQFHFSTLINTAAESLPGKRQQYEAGTRSIIEIFTGKELKFPDDYPILNTEPLRKLRDLK